MFSPFCDEPSVSPQHQLERCLWRQNQLVIMFMFPWIPSGVFLVMFDFCKQNVFPFQFLVVGNRTGGWRGDTEGGEGEPEMKFMVPMQFLWLVLGSSVICVVFW